jgi:catechol 2,3-dioxygenase-like lactoylglutathione lyase family enzyme
MIEKLTNVTLFVTDQDEALEFHTTKLGFVKQADHKYGDGPRYLAVGLPGQEISLVLWKGTAAVRDVASGGTGGAWVLSSNDVAQEYQRLAAHGVRFEHDRPQQAPGALWMSFADPFGNRFVLRQPTAGSAGR